MLIPLLRRLVLTVGLIVSPVLLSSCGSTSDTEAAGEEAEADYERGPHNGRMLRDGDFALEITIAEDGVPPEFHIYPFLNDEPLDPSQVELNVTLSRLDGEVNRFAFAPQQDYLRGNGVVTEPHSFDVEVIATYTGERHSWSYESYEGRTSITADAAREAGIEVEEAGPATFDQTIDLTGLVQLAPGAQSEVGARFPGRVMAVMGNVGDRVSAGTLLARVESSESLQTYSVTSPRAGIVLERRTNVGDVTGSDPIFIIGDLADVYAALPIYPRDLERVRPGQRVLVESLVGDHARTATISGFLPLGDATTQTVTARAPLPNADGYWREGMGVTGRLTISRRRVPLAVRTSALQTFRDFTVVFARVGDTYEVRMLELGQRTPEWTEVLSGITPGQAYVTEGSFIIKADIEKAGASHDH
jgi:membrane fusion protein, heavy metal efflux system